MVEVRNPEIELRRLRTRLVKVTRRAERLGAAVLMISPFVAAFTRVPTAGLLIFAAGFLMLGTSTLIHVATLPTELDASFNRALPVLDRFKILKPVDRRHARRCPLQRCPWRNRRLRPH